MVRMMVAWLTVHQLAWPWACAGRSCAPGHPHHAAARRRRWQPEPSLRTAELRLQEIEFLAEKDPDLKAQLATTVEKLKAEFAAIPPITIKIQTLDKSDEPAGKPYTITSEDGVIDLGYTTLTSEEFLLLVQAEQHRPERGLAIDDEWEHDDWGSGRPWRSDTVDYYFTSSVSSSEQAWMRKAMERMEDGTGMSFEEARDAEWWMEVKHFFFVSRSLRISKEQLSGTTTGWATVGEVSRSKLVMDSDYVTNERWFNHEMGHVFGLLHEHQRHDRDTYITVAEAKRTKSDYAVLPKTKKKYGFLRLWSWTADISTTHSTPYDYHSIMHYPKGTDITLKSNGKEWHVHEDTVANVSINSVWEDENGDTWFSPWDIYTIKKRYGITPNDKPDYTPAPAFPEDD